VKLGRDCNRARRSSYRRSAYISVGCAGSGRGSSGMLRRETGQILLDIYLNSLGVH
jgi:hypothetical protein